MSQRNIFATLRKAIGEGETSRTKLGALVNRNPSEIIRYDRKGYIKLPETKRGMPRGVYGVVAENRETLDGLLERGVSQAEAARTLGTDRQRIQQYLADNPKLYEKWREKNEIWRKENEKPEYMEGWEIVETLAYMGCPLVKIAELLDVPTHTVKSHIKKIIPDRQPELYKTWKTERRRYPHHG